MPADAEAALRCAFNGHPYVSGLAHIGTPEAHPSGRFWLLRRPVPGTGLVDGVGPWPYLWIDGPADLRALREDFRHMLTVTVVAQPGYRPGGDAGAVFLKDHFFFDPARPAPALSRRTRKRLRKAEARGRFTVVADMRQRLAFFDLYRGLVHRRGLSGGLFDYRRRHFEAIAALPNALFFRVDDPAGCGAMACGAMACGIVQDDMLQILHTAASPAGLTWNASYLLMHGLQRHAAAHGLRLSTGGLPATGSAGLRRFKERWANAFVPVYMLRIVNDARAYGALRIPGNDFFPAYRRPDTFAPVTAPGDARRGHPAVEGATCTIAS